MKLTIALLLLAVVISATSCIIGYYKYRNTIHQLYNDNGYAIANLAMEQVDGDFISTLLSYNDQGVPIRERQNTDGTWSVTTAAYEKGDRFQVATHNYQLYQDMAKSLSTIRKKADLQYLLLYIPIVDEIGQNHLAYLFDAENDYFDQIPLGHSDPLNPIHFSEVYGIYKSGHPSDSHFISHSTYGYTTSAILPVKDSLGNTVAVLDCYVPMEIVESTMNEYICTVVLAIVFLVFLFVIVFSLYLRQRVVRPLLTITHHAQEFVSNQDKRHPKLLDIQTGDEIQTLANTFNQMTLDLGNYITQLTEVTAEKERIGAELSVATNIQASMLPGIFPAFPDYHEFDIYATMTPAKEVGGDFYDFFLIDDDHLVMVMADVSGKGVPAALFMVISKTLLKNCAQTGRSPKEILELVNTQLCEGNESEMFVTVWIGIYEISTGKLIAANAGHEYPALKRSNGLFELYADKHGLVLAGMDCSRYTEYELQLYPGDQLFVYTDGVPEATNKVLELFGTDRMIASLNQVKDSDMHEILDHVKLDIDTFVGTAPQFDDITMLGLTIKEFSYK